MTRIKAYNPDVKQKFANLGFAAQSSTRDELKARIATDFAKFGEIIKTAGIKAE